MARKRTGSLGGSSAPAEPKVSPTKAPRPSEPAQETPKSGFTWDIPQTETPEKPLFESIAEVQIGGESPSAQKEREDIQPEKEGMTSASIVRGVQQQRFKDFLKPGGKVTLEDQASLHHSNIQDYSDLLANKIEEYRRTIPAVKDGKPHPIFDDLQSVINEADDHLAQASIEYNRGHHGVSYLDKYAGMDNKIIPSVGIAKLRGKPSALGKLLSSTSNQQVTAEDRLIPKGSINLTRRAVDLLHTVNSALTDLTAKAKEVSSVQGFQAPEVHDTNGEIHQGIEENLHKFTNLLDIAHANKNPTRNMPEGRAMAESRREELRRLTPAMLGGMGLKGLAQQKLSDIKEMFDRRARIPKVLESAMGMQRKFQQQMVHYTFERVFGKKLSENEAAQEINKGIARQNNVEAARTAAIRQRFPVTPVFEGAEVPEEVKKTLSLRGTSVETNTETTKVPIIKESFGTKTVVPTTESRVRSVPGGGFETYTPVTAQDVVNPEDNQTKEYINKLSEAVNSSNNSELISRFNEHLERYNHHVKLSKLNADATKGAFVKEGTTGSILNLKPGTMTQEKAARGEPAGVTSKDERPFYMDNDGNVRLEGFKPQHIFRAAPSVMAGHKDNVSEISVDSSYEPSHPYYQKPTVESSSYGLIVREGKNDEKIAELQKQRKSNTTVDGEIKDRRLHNKLSAQIQGLMEEHRQAKANLIEREQDGVRNKNYVGKKSLAQADQTYLDNLARAGGRQPAISDLKSNLTTLHSIAADDAFKDLVEAAAPVTTREETTTTVKAIKTPIPENSGIKARVEPYKLMPNPELPSRQSLLTQFEAVSGLPASGKPNVEILKTASGAPMDYKQARRSSRRVVFSDSLGRQYAWGADFAPPESEEEFYQKLEERKNPSPRKGKRKTSFTNSGDIVDIVAKSAKASQADLAAQKSEEDKSRRDLAASLLPKDLQPVLTSTMPNVRGILPLGDATKPIVSKSGKSQIVPGVGVVPIPERKKSAKKGGRRKKAESIMEGLTEKDFKPIEELSLSDIMPKAEPDLAKQDEKEARKKANLGRQFQEEKPTQNNIKNMANPEESK